MAVSISNYRDSRYQLLITQNFKGLSYFKSQRHIVSKSGHRFPQIDLDIWSSETKIKSHFLSLASRKLKRAHALRYFVHSSWTASAGFTKPNLKRHFQPALFILITIFSRFIEKHCALSVDAAAAHVRKLVYLQCTEFSTSVIKDPSKRDPGLPEALSTKAT